MAESTSHIKPIVDKFGRIHNYLRISLTERCNLRCFYCMPEEGVALREKSVFMSSEEIIAIAKEFVELGIKKIRLTGGEPLVKKDAAYIIEELGKLPIELAITTNAVNVDKFIDVLKCAQVKSINVSLDSLVADRFNAISRRSYFDRIMSNINLLLENDFEVKVNVVLIKGTNDDEIIDFINWTKKTKINIRFIEFMPFDGNKWEWEKKVSFKELLDKVDEHYGADGFHKIQDAKNDTSRNYQLKNGQGTFGIISSVTNPFCDTCNRIRLTADGKIKNCLFSESESDLLTAYRNNESIEPIIRNSILAKHPERGGNVAFENLTEKAIKNRSMITIGG
ncbi:MAG: GTP 3',8-cyclase MoaA [Crocinitomicaceae bacterium]|nr:GTP 3',8-cyclase MoaA [Crocinitomicaceae bacterium]